MSGLAKSADRAAVATSRDTAGEWSWKGVRKEALASVWYV